MLNIPVECYINYDATVLFNTEIAEHYQRAFLSNMSSRKHVINVF